MECVRLPRLVRWCRIDSAAVGEPVVSPRGLSKRYNSTPMTALVLAVALIATPASAMR